MSTDGRLISCCHWGKPHIPGNSGSMPGRCCWSFGCWGEWENRTLVWLLQSTPISPQASPVLISLTTYSIPFLRSISFLLDAILMVIGKQVQKVREWLMVDYARGLHIISSDNVCNRASVGMRTEWDGWSKSSTSLGHTPVSITAWVLSCVPLER